MVVGLAERVGDVFSPAEYRTQVPLRRRKGDNRSSKNMALRRDLYRRPSPGQGSATSRRERGWVQSPTFARLGGDIHP